MTDAAPNENARRAPGEAFGSASGTARGSDSTPPRANLAGLIHPIPPEAGRVDISRIAADALQRVDAVLSSWLPGGKWEGAEWVALNPTRADAAPGSFKVNRDTGRWADFATDEKGGDLVSLVAMLEGGCDQATAARKLAAFLGSPAAGPARAPKSSKPSPPAVFPVPDDAPPLPTRHPQWGEPSARWTYRSAEGRDLFHVCRFDPPGQRKQVLPLSLRRVGDRLEWRWLGLDRPRPLYGLDRLAAAPDLPVIVTEGEKAADAAARLLPGWVATTAPNGSDGAGSADWGPLTGRRCVIWGDADAPGAKHAAAVQRLALDAGAAAVAVAPLEALARIRGAELPERFDAADAEGEGLDAAALDAWLRAAPDTAEADTDTGEGEGEPADPCAGLPCFRIVEWEKGLRNGVHWFGLIRDKETDAVRPAPPVWICDPLRVTALTRDDRGHEWGRLLEWLDGDGRLHRWAMPCELLAGSGEELRAALLRRGLAITHGAERRRLADYVQGERPTVRARSVTRTGWSGGAFVWPDHTEGGSDAEPVVLQLASPDGAAVGQGGTLDGWRQEVAAPCAGNSRLVLALSVAFAGPCLHPLRAEGGGFHFRGKSSAGKSTALRVAASLYGPPCFVRTWRATDNALEAIAALHSDLLLCLDELGELPAKAAGATGYLLANGQGKARAARDGSARASAAWRLLFLSSGEVGLSDLIAEAGGRTRAGQEVRFLDIPADAGRGLGLLEAVPAGVEPGAFADALTDAAGRHYGHAGRAWVRWLVQHHAEARDALRQLRDTIAGDLTPQGAAGQVRRVAQRFALAAAAGEVATAQGFTGWTPGEATEAAAVCFRAWLDARGTAGSSEPAAMLRQVRAFLEAHGDARFTPLDSAPQRDGGNLSRFPPPQRDTRDRAGFRRDAGEGAQEFLILPEVFRQEVCKGFDSKAVADALAEAKALKLDSKGGRTLPQRLPGLGLVRVYAIGPALWGAADG